MAQIHFSSVNLLSCRQNRYHCKLCRSRLMAHDKVSSSGLAIFFFTATTGVWSLVHKRETPLYSLYRLHIFIKIWSPLDPRFGLFTGLGLNFKHLCCNQQWYVWIQRWRSQLQQLRNENVEVYKTDPIFPSLGAGRSGHVYFACAVMALTHLFSVVFLFFCFLFFCFVFFLQVMVHISCW